MVYSCLSLDEMFTLAEKVEDWKLDPNYIEDSKAFLKKACVLRGEIGDLTVILNAGDFAKTKEGDYKYMSSADQEYYFIKVLTSSSPGQELTLGRTSNYNFACSQEELKRFTKLYDSVYEPASKSYERDRTESLDKARTILHRD